jgi:hypothetical protein
MKKNLFSVLSLAAILKKQFSGNTIDASVDIRGYRRGFLKLSGFLGLTGWMIQFGAGRALAQESEPAIPVYITDLVISSYPDPGTVNLSVGLTTGEMCQITLLTKLPYGLKNADGSTTIVAEDGIALNPLQMVGTEYIDATPLINEGAVELTFRQEERNEKIVAKRFSATIDLYPITGKSGFGELLIDMVENQDKTPNGISMMIIGNGGEVLMKRWVDKKLQADPTVTVESNMEEDFYGVRKGRRKMKLGNQESSPFQEKRGYTEPELSAMTDEEKIKAAPELEGLTKSNVSTLKGNLIIYRNAEGKAEKVYNLTNNAETTLLQAGIFEVPLTTGENWEMLGFETGQEAIDYAVLVDHAQSTTMDIQTNKSARKIEPRVYTIEGYEYVAGRPIFNTEDKFVFGVLITRASTGSMIVYLDQNDNCVTVYANQDAEEIVDEISSRSITAPTN